MEYRWWRRNASAVKRLPISLAVFPYSFFFLSTSFHELASSTGEMELSAITVDEMGGGGGAFLLLPFTRERKKNKKKK